MPAGRRIAPEWKDVWPQLTKAIKEKEEDVCECDGYTQYLDAEPSIQFRYSCGANYIQCLTACSGCRGTTVVGFQWGHRMDHHQMIVWSQNSREELHHDKSFPLGSNYKVEHLVFVSSQRVFVGACSDLSLRVFSHPGQGFVLQYRAALQGSVFCMHYCEETEELLTGGMGIITVWGFWTSLDVHLGIIRVLDWNCCSLRHDTIISSLVTEQQTSTLYALCDDKIKSFHLKSKKELRSFRGRGQGTLHCILSDGVQRHLYTGDISGCVQVWSWDSQSLLQEFHAHSCCVSAMALRPDTQTLLTSSPDGWVKEWNSCGELLAKILLDDPGGVRSLWLINENKILCHSSSSFSVWQLQNIYQPFHVTCCGLRYLRRVECGAGRARILAVSEDSIARIVSPVSGEMLLLSWTFLQLESALAFAYNLGQEELFVACGTPEVLVLDTSLCPCPAKRILCTSKNHECDESVMSLEAVVIAGDSTEPHPCFVFSGHRSGTLQLLSAPPRFRCRARKAHGGAVLQISSLPGPIAQLCCYGEDAQLTVWTVDVGEERVELVLLTQISHQPGLSLTQLMPGLIFAVSPGQCLLLYSLSDKRCITVERSPPTAIKCMDVCVALGLVAVSGPAGIVEVWDTNGTQQAEIRLGAPVSQVCFLNARGDLLACFSGSISVIAGVRYLPVPSLKQVLARAPSDDLPEDPVPFLPRSPSSYDLCLVPKISLKPGEETFHSTTSAINRQVPDLNMHREMSSEKTRTPPRREQQGLPSYAVPAVKPTPEEEITAAEEAEPESLDWCGLDTPVQPADVEPEAFGWPVAPDGFIPNSVIRNWGRNQELQEPEELAEPEALPGVSMYKRVHERAEAAKVRPQRGSEPARVVELSGKKLESFTEPELDEEDVRENLLKKTARSQWLAKRPEAVELDSVMRAVMFTMDCTDAGLYKNCAEALFSLSKAYGIPPLVKKRLALNLLKDVQAGNPHWKRLDGLKALLQLNLLQEKDLFVMAKVLIDQTHDLRQLALDGLTQVYRISTKAALLDHLHKLEEAPARQKLLKQLNAQLTEDLQLQQDLPGETPEPTKSLSRVSGTDHGEENRGVHTFADDCIKNPCELRLISAGSSVDSSPQYVVLSEERQVARTRAPASESSRPAPPAPPAPPPDDVREVSFPNKLPPRHGGKKYAKFSVSLPERKRRESTPGSASECLVDPLLMILYKKLKDQLLTYRPSHKLVPPPPPLCAQIPSDCGYTPRLVQPPPRSRPQLFPSEPIRGRGGTDWRETLHQLTSTYGFRSQNAATQRELHTPEPGPNHPPFKPHPVLPSQPSLGQRVVETLHMSETPPVQFHHVLPLSWQLNVHTLDRDGRSQYGRLSIDWRAGPLDKPGIKLPLIRSRLPSVLPQGGSVG